MNSCRIYGMNRDWTGKRIYIRATFNPENNVQEQALKRLKKKQNVYNFLGSTISVTTSTQTLYFVLEIENKALVLLPKTV